MAILAAPVRQITGAKPASRNINYALLGLAFIALAVAKLVSIYWEMGQRLQKVGFGSEGCTRYHDVMSPEDIVPVFEGVFVGSSEERRKHMMYSVGAEATDWGNLVAIWNVDTPGQDPKTARLELEGFPEGVAFRPHGMYYRRETKELFVVNHAYSQGGERIDVFKVSETFPQQPLPAIDQSLLERTPIEDVAVSGQGEGSLEAGSDPHPVGPPVVDIGVAVAVLGSDDDGQVEVEANVKVEAPGNVEGGEPEAEDGDPAGEGGIGERAEGGLSEGDSEPELPGDEGGNSGNEQDGSEVPVASTKNAESEVEVAEAEATEEIVETPKEMAKRLKREAKEAAAKTKAEERLAQMEAKKIMAEEKAVAKAAAARASARAKGLSRGTAPVKLTYSFSVDHDVVTKNYGALNDLVLVGDDELYVTQFLQLPQPLHGPTQPDGLTEHFQVHASLLSTLSQISRAPIIRCTEIRGPDISCEPFPKGRGVMYNGIAASPNGERLLVADTMAMQLVVFNRSVETGALTLRQRVDLPGSPDNLELDLHRAAKGEEAYTVGLISLWDFFSYSSAISNAKDTAEVAGIKMAGGVASVVFDKDTGEYTSLLEMWQDGSLLSISSAAPTASGARLMGSAVEDGFLLCRPPPCPHGNDDTEACFAWPGPPVVEEVEEAG